MIISVRPRELQQDRVKYSRQEEKVHEKEGRWSISRILLRETYVEMSDCQAEKMKRHKTFSYVVCSKKD